jgi:hypothetical protein
VKESIVASAPSDDDPRWNVFLVKWKHFSQEENTWEIYGNVVEHDVELLKEYYTRNLTVGKDGRFGNQKRIKEKI